MIHSNNPSDYIKSGFYYRIGLIGYYTQTVATDDKGALKHIAGLIKKGVSLQSAICDVAVILEEGEIPLNEMDWSYIQEATFITVHPFGEKYAFSLN